MTYKSKADMMGMALSLICLVHCLILPLFLTSIPLLGIEILDNKTLEVVILLLSAFVGGYAIKKGFGQYHRNKSVIILFVVGFLVITAGNWVQSFTEVLSK